MNETPARGSSGDVRGRLKERLAEALAEMVRVLGADDARVVMAEAAGTVLAPPPVARPAGGGARRKSLRFAYAGIIGESDALLRVLEMLDRVVDSDLPVLITGESGTGKELIARAIHENSSRAPRAFVRENCAAIPETLLESELFGYRRGAFTGATQDKRGLFEEGHGGSIFLDEISEMPLNMQAKLMRVLQEGEIRPVGSPNSIQVDVRLISATNRELRDMVAQGRFREDLFFRLNVVPIHVPPLRERRDDIPLLVAAFLEEAARKAKRPAKTLGPDVLERLHAHSWPGNVRELKNEIDRAYALSGPTIQVRDLSPEVAEAPQAGDPSKRRS